MHESYVNKCKHSKGIKWQLFNLYILYIYSGFLHGRNKVSPDSEKIERYAAELLKRNFSSVEEIQEYKIRKIIMTERVGAAARNFYDRNNAALGLYQKANQYVLVTTAENPFAGSRRGLGVGLMCFVGEGQVNGEPPTEYYVNEGGYTEMVQRSFDMYS